MNNDKKHLEMLKRLKECKEQIEQLQMEIEYLNSQINYYDNQNNIYSKQNLESPLIFKNDNISLQEYEDIVSKSFENRTKKQILYTRKQLEELKKILMSNQGIKNK